MPVEAIFRRPVQTVSREELQLQLMINTSRDDAAPAFPEGHDHPRDGGIQHRPTTTLTRISGSARRLNGRREAHAWMNVYYLSDAEPGARRQVRRRSQRRRAEGQTQQQQQYSAATGPHSLHRRPSLSGGLLSLLLTCLLVYNMVCFTLRAAPDKLIHPSLESRNDPTAPSGSRQSSRRWRCQCPLAPGAFCQALQARFRRQCDAVDLG